MATPAANAPRPKASPPPGVLPRPLTPLVGREDDVAAVGMLAGRDDVRLLTLIGAGGVGKTRLAIAVAQYVQAGRFDQVAFVALAAVRDSDLILQAIAGALTVPSASDTPILERIRQFVGDRRILLVVDNLEQLPAAGPLLVELLAGCPNLTILATSRARLNVNGERLYPVHALGTPSAVALFVQRGEAVVPELELNESTRPTIEAICLRLDGLPLAIELAATRLTVLSLPDLLARLEQPLALLKGGPQDAPDRQRTMRHAIAWSHDLLPQSARVLFNRLGLFVGGFTLEAAQKMVDECAGDIDDLDTLIASSLVHRAPAVGGVPRYGMLETVREFALEQLAASGEDQAMQHRHAACLAAAMERQFSLQDGPEVRAAHDRIDVELQNCRAAMTWCLETGAAEIGIRLASAIWRTWWYALANGERPWHERLAEGRHWLARTLEMRDGVPLPVLVQALTGASELAGADGDYITALSLARELLERSMEQDNTLGIFYGQFQLGTLALRIDDHLTARDRFLAALAAAPGLPEPENRMSQVHALIAEVEEHLGNMLSARAHFEEAMTLARLSANPFAICLAGPGLGRHLREAGELTRAAEVQAEAISGALAQRRPAGVARALTELAMIAQASGHRERGQRLLHFSRQLPGHQVDGTPELGVFIADEDIRSNDAFVATASDGIPVGEEALIAEIAELVELLAAAAPGEELAPDSQPFGLTRRELEVLRLLAEGRSNRGIAEALSLSERTVEHHLLHVYTKLGLESRAAAVAFALRQGLA